MTSDEETLSKAAIRRLERAARAKNTFYIHGVSEIPTPAKQTEIIRTPKTRKKITKRKLPAQTKPRTPKKTLHIAPRPQTSIFEEVEPRVQANRPVRATRKSHARPKNNRPKGYKLNLVSVHSKNILLSYALGNSDDVTKHELKLGDRAIAKTFERLTNILSKRLDIAKPNLTRSRMFLYLIEHEHINLDEFENLSPSSSSKNTINVDQEDINLIALQAYGLTEREISNFLQLKPAEIRRQNAKLREAFQVANKEAVFIRLLLNGTLPKTRNELETLIVAIDRKENIVEFENKSNLSVSFEKTEQLSKLNDMQTKILTLLIQGYTSEEIGGIMNLQRGTVNAARHAMRKIFGSRTLSMGIIKMIKDRNLIIRFDNDTDTSEVEIASLSKDEFELLKSIYDLNFFDKPTAKRKSPEDKLMNDLVFKLKIRDIYNIRQIPNHEHLLMIEAFRHGHLPQSLLPSSLETKCAPAIS